ncbi:MAG: pseudaminic acid biosynthesis-associated methylase [Micavibrio sp.]|nr:pseudaminic acid biosynthesis-associated methylase [Micavibrio sp.]|tara:strand:+ start:820 stop:1440 length:621 start_codon:yes stop_codon:yes gene_type:complete
MSSYTTEQENFWAQDFGKNYIDRNSIKDILPAKLKFFSDILPRVGGVTDIFEFGANIGINLHALHTLLPKANLKALEINPDAVKELRKNDWLKEIQEGSLLEKSFPDQADLVLTSGVLIYINPDKLEKAYQNIYDTSRKYILLAEYYNPSPVSITYRGHNDRLFKRDFAGDMLEKFDNLRLIDYGFTYKRDPHFPLDDITWFLMEK